MSDEQINAAIAEACGWIGCSTCDSDECAYNSLPNYCADLNAIHEAEKVLFQGFEDEPELSEFWDDYCTYLVLECDAYLSYHATARQKAKAFLRAIGKWEATTEQSSVDQK